LPTRSAFRGWSTTCSSAPGRSPVRSAGRTRRSISTTLVLEEAPPLAERGRVQVDVRAVSAARVLGDAEQLARTSRNLTSNTERHATRTVTLELRENAEHSLLVGADYGPGIPAQHHATVFKAFTRLDEPVPATPAVPVSVWPSSMTSSIVT
jgi:C4-dicarboxylate-specific signal transduction histidine kinase